MRTILLICGVILAAIATWIVLNFRAPNHYGGAFTGAPTVAVSDLLERPADFLGKRVTILGQVEDQCPTTGCFFYFSAGNKRLKIELGDVVDTIPRRAGARVMVEGQLVPYGDSYQFLGIAAEFQ